MEDGLTDDLLYPLVADGGLLLEGVVGAAGLDGSKIFGRHGSGLGERSGIGDGGELVQEMLMFLLRREDWSDWNAMGHGGGDS